MGFGLWLWLFFLCCAGGILVAVLIFVGAPFLTMGILYVVGRVGSYIEKVLGIDDKPIAPPKKKEPIKWRWVP